MTQSSVCHYASRESYEAAIPEREVAFFGENQISEDLSAERILPHQIRRMFEHAPDKDLPTDFA